MENCPECETGIHHLPTCLDGEIQIHVDCHLGPKTYWSKHDRIVRVLKCANRQVLLVRESDGLERRRRAYRWSSAAHQALPYDLPSYYESMPGRHLLLAVREQQTQRTFRLISFLHLHIDTNEPTWPGWTVTCAWTARAYRRQGLARALLGEALATLELETADLYWLVPFTDSGNEFALAHGCIPKGFLKGGNCV